MNQIILGIDPGTNFMGYGILKMDGKKAEFVTMGVLDLSKMDDHYNRLQRTFFFVQELIDQYGCTNLAIETQFVDKNIQTMLRLAHGQGVAIAAALSKDLAVYEYSPMKIKMAITGNGHAEKEQVKAMLQRLLKLTDEQIPKKLDASDALGIAYCHFLQLQSPLGIDQKHYKNWADFARRNSDKVHK